MELLVFQLGDRVCYILLSFLLLSRVFNYYDLIDHRYKVVSYRHQQMKIMFPDSGVLPRIQLRWNLFSHSFDLSVTHALAPNQFADLWNGFSFVHEIGSRRWIIAGKHEVKQPFKNCTLIENIKIPIKKNLNANKQCAEKEKFYWKTRHDIESKWSARVSKLSFRLAD